LYLLNPVLEKLKEPAHKLIGDIHSYLEDLGAKLLDKIFMRFPSMILDIGDITANLMREEKEKTIELIESIIESE